MSRCLKRTLDCGGAPYTEHQLRERCRTAISNEGVEAVISIRIKGVRGHGLKKQRRLFPHGPLGKVWRAETGLLHVEYSAAALLSALSGQHAVFRAMAHHYTSVFGGSYPQQMPLALAMQFAQQHLRVEVDPEIVECVFQKSPPSAFGNAWRVIVDLLEVEHIALQRRWKSVDMQRWKSAGLTSPLLCALKTRPGAGSQSMSSMVFRGLSQREAKLLERFRKADEPGKVFIEQGASFAAAAVTTAVVQKEIA